MAKGFTNSIIGGSEGLYAWKKYSINMVLSEEIIQQSVDLPSNYYGNFAVNYNNEIHILDSTSHYKWNGTEWVSVSTLPIDFDATGYSIVYNNEIHIIGGSVGHISHYKWDGVNWTNCGYLPYSFYYGAAVVYNNELHILGSSSQETTGETNYQKHYKWDGVNWTSASTLPQSFYSGSAVVYNNKIHILGSGISLYKQIHYAWDGINWEELTEIPISSDSLPSVVFDEDIHVLCQASANSYTRHYKWDGNSWTELVEIDKDLTNCCGVVYNDNIYILAGDDAPRQWRRIYGYLPSYTFKDYIVSDKADAYPEDGEQGGYYYKSVGTLNFDCGIVTLTEETAEIVVEHNLGSKPTYCSLVYTNTWSEYAYTTLVVCTGGAFARSSASTAYFQSTTTNITFQRIASYSFAAGATYFWAAYK